MTPLRREREGLEITSAASRGVSSNLSIDISPDWWSDPDGRIRFSVHRTKHRDEMRS